MMVCAIGAIAHLFDGFPGKGRQFGLGLKATSPVHGACTFRAAQRIVGKVVG